MDFYEFAENFQRRTAKRMVDFEAALLKAQKQMEETVRQQEIARQMNIKKPPTMYPKGTIRGGKVQGVLRREAPGGMN
ncbi:hypothetical protein QP027_01730 [Corynebacterium breve]|uniref:Uncharacterized protein n=1 Tax=Corynebacterium breve TaxID=3049799 RepID=A0ABY8VES0_9CORY|nr:hypothetical protein [Corynebacterium breve]WIM68145.1 hypothetical protein QP027_01730 [Corynebacterium breve]